MTVKTSLFPSVVAYQREDTAVPAGVSIADALELLGRGDVLRYDARAYVVLLREGKKELVSKGKCFDRILCDGDALEVYMLPQGGGGGGFGGLLAVAVIAAVSFGAAAALAGPIGAAWNSAVLSTSLPLLTNAAAFNVVFGVTFLGGMMAFSALSGAQTPKLSGSAQSVGTEQRSETYSISGTQNRLRKFEPVPFTVGTHRVYPPLAVEPYAEVLGDETYFRQMFCVLGHVDVSEMRIGDTPIEEFEDVELEVREGLPTDSAITLFPADVHDESISVELEQDVQAVRRTPLNVDEATVFIYFPRGLRTLPQDGSASQPKTVQVKMEYAVAGSGSYSPWPNYEGTSGVIDITSKSTDQITRTFRAVFPSRGQYDIRVTRISPAGTDYDFWDTTWSNLQSLRNEDPINDDLIYPLCKIAMRIKATGQLNGVVDEFNFLAKTYCDVWDTETEEFTEQLSNNPAWNALRVYRGPGIKKTLPDSRIDLQSFAAWAAYCDDNSFESNGVIDYTTSVYEAFNDVAKAGRGAFSLTDNDYSVVYDHPDDTVVQLFTPRNSWGFEASRKYPDQPHALRCQFINEDKDYQQDELIVYYDGYTDANATEFEDMDFFMVTNADQVYKNARFSMACGRLRPETFTLNVSTDYIVCNPGDRVRLAHDVLGVGLAYLRADAIGMDGAEENYTDMTLEGDVVFEVGKQYGVCIRTLSGSQLVREVTGNGVTRVVTFATPIPVGDAITPDADSLISFGELGSEYLDCVVSGMQPLDDLYAQLELIEYNAAIFTADTGPIPPHDSKITLGPDTVRRPAAPNILSISSNETVLYRGLDGTFKPRAVLYFNESGGNAKASYFQAQYKPEFGKWAAIPDLPSDSTIASFTDVMEGEYYDFRIRSVSKYGAASAWSYANDHIVVGKTTPPPNVESLVLDGKVLRWAYPNQPVDFKGFEVRYHVGTAATWSTAYKIHSGYISASQFDVGGLSGVNTFLVRAIDTSYIYSASSARVTADLGIPSVDNIVHTYAYEPTFSGTIVGASIVSDVLVADSVALFWRADDQCFWCTETESFWVDNYGAMSYTFTLDLPSAYAGLNMVLDLDTEGEDIEIEYRYTGDNPFYGIDDELFWGSDSAMFWEAENAFLPWVGKLTNIKSGTYDFRVSIGAGSVQGEIRKAQVIIDATTKAETISDLTINTTNTTVATSKTYVNISYVNPFVHDSGAIELVTKNPLILRATDGSSHVVDLEIRGY